MVYRINQMCHDILFEVRYKSYFSMQTTTPVRPVVQTIDLIMQTNQSPAGVSSTETGEEKIETNPSIANTEYVIRYTKLAKETCVFDRNVNSNSTSAGLFTVIPS